MWLAPEQVQVIPVMPELDEYAESVNARLLEVGLRSAVDLGDARLAAKVRTAATRKIPLILVVGRREAEEGTVTVRDRSGEETAMSLDDFVAHAPELVATKSLEGAGHLVRE